jgi:hypothetical protein
MNVSWKIPGKEREEKLRNEGFQMNESRCARWVAGKRCLMNSACICQTPDRRLWDHPQAVIRNGVRYLILEPYDCSLDSLAKLNAELHGLGLTAELSGLGMWADGATFSIWIKKM